MFPSIQNGTVKYERLIDSTDCSDLPNAKRFHMTDAEHVRYISERRPRGSTSGCSERRNTKRALCKSFSAPVTSQNELPTNRSTPCKHIRVQPTTYEVDRANRLEDWDIGRCINEFWKKNNGVIGNKEHSRIMKGCDIPIEMPKRSSLSDMMVVCQKWNTRRCALHVYNAKELKRRLKVYMMLKCNIY